jgi:hypothetical protein
MGGAVPVHERLPAAGRLLNTILWVQFTVTLILYGLPAHLTNCSCCRWGTTSARPKGSGGRAGRCGAWMTTGRSSRRTHCR